MMGSQPSGLQHNFNKDPCALCDDDIYDDSIHVLFDCEKLSPLRCRMYLKMVDSMPNALADQFGQMSKNEKLILMCSGFGHNYIREWKELYSCTASYVHCLYKLRSKSYDDLPIDNG